ncbi:hypothetical protein [Streptomyces sp. NPDC057253]|uniref:hypothetical protein n=1 Tax=Streptomyces sp. NPDC057253 TaxID=3346069 RepID=UPI00362E63F3
MQRNTLPRHRLAGGGWAHPYGHGPFSPFLYADGGDGGGSGSGSGDTGGTGEGGDSGSGGDGGSGDGGNSGAGDGGQGGGGAAKDGGQGKEGEDDSAKVKRLEKELADARREAGKSRNDAKRQAADDAVKALTQQLGKALGFVKDETPPDPKALAEAITAKDTTIAERDSTIRGLNVELAVWGRAEKLSAKAGALLDSRGFLSAISALDPAEKGFTTALDDAIKAAVKENPSFAATAPAGKSGGDLSGGTGEGAAKKRSTSLSGAVGAHYQT